MAGARTSTAQSLLSDPARAITFARLIASIGESDAEQFARVGPERSAGNSWTPRQTLLSPSVDGGFLAVTYYRKLGEMGQMRAELHFNGNGQLIPFECLADQALTKRWNYRELASHVDNNLVVEGRIREAQQLLPIGAALRHN